MLKKLLFLLPAFLIIFCGKSYAQTVTAFDGQSIYWTQGPNLHRTTLTPYTYAGVPSGGCTPGTTAVSSATSNLYFCPPIPNNIWTAATGSGGCSNGLTVNSGGAGDTAFTFDCSAAHTLSYNSVGAAPLASPTFTGTVTSPAYIDSGLTAGTSPICPNGVGGAFTTSGCAGGGASLFTSYQFGSNAAITATGTYFQLTFDSNFSPTYSGSGTNVSPYIATFKLASTITATLNGNATTATDLASYPTKCTGVNFSQGLTSGSDNCAQPSNVTGNAATVTTSASVANASYSVLTAPATSGSQAPNTIASFTINPSTGAMNVPGALTVSSCTGCGSGASPAGSTNDIQINGGAGAFGAVNTHGALTGQIVETTNGAPPAAKSPGVADGNSGAHVTTTPYAVACDSTTALLDRATTIIFDSGASVVTLPDHTASGCGANMFFALINESGGALTVNRGGTDTINITGVSGGPTTAATTFSLPNNSSVSLNNGEAAIWNARVYSGLGVLATIATGTLTNGDYCTYSSTGPTIACNTAGSGVPAGTFQTNGVNNTTSTSQNLITSTTNTVGLTATPSNPGTNQEKIEIGGTYTGSIGSVTGTLPNGSESTNTVTATAAASAAKQICTASGASKTCAYIDFPERYNVPAANCNNTTAGAGWSIGSGGTVTCRAGTNNKGGYISITDTSTTFATFQVTIPEDWDTGSNPYIRFYIASTDATSGHTIIPSIQVACYKGDGSTTDDVAANAAHSSSTITLNTTANQFWSNSNVQMNSTDVTGCVAGALMQITVGRATDTATNAEFYGADVTFPRLLTVGAE